MALIKCLHNAVLTANHEHGFWNKIAYWLIDDEIDYLDIAVSKDIVRYYSNSIGTLTTLNVDTKLKTR